MRTEARKTLLIGCMNSAHIAEATTPVRDAELAVATRGGMIESRHRGTVVVLSPGGDVILALGDAHRPIFARSTLKPFQAIGALKAGAPLRGAQVAIACASHRGTFEQMRAVQEALAAAGLSADALQCPAVYPTDSGTRATMLQAGLAKTPLAFECSGKHAAFLWACAAKSERGELEPDAALWSIDTYLDPQHPLQRMIVEEVEAFARQRRRVRRARVRVITGGFGPRLRNPGHGDPQYGGGCARLNRSNRDGGLPRADSGPRLPRHGGERAAGRCGETRRGGDAVHWPALGGERRGEDF